MATKSEQYVSFLKQEGYVPEVEDNGDVRFKIQGEIILISAAEEDPQYFKISYLHQWDPARTAEAMPKINELNLTIKSVKTIVADNVLVFTIENLLPNPDDFRQILPRCVQLLGTARAMLARGLAGEAIQPPPPPAPQS